MTELHTMSVHALSERNEQQEQQIAELVIELAEVREQLAAANTELKNEQLRNKPLRALIKSLEQQLTWYRNHEVEYRAAAATIDSERAANAQLTRELQAKDAELEARRAEPEKVEPVAWQPMDYTAPPDEGMYWVVLESPEYDCDVDDYGRTFGTPTGNTVRRVLLANIEHTLEPADPNDLSISRPYPVAMAVISGERNMQDEEWITHYADVSTPAAPQQEQK